MSAFIIGLTGGIGSGKTTVSDLFAVKGIDIIDADIVAREVVKVGSSGLSSIVDRFGDSMLTEEGTLNRAKLRELIFADESKKEWLNQLLHPLIRQEILSQLAAATSKYCILVAPLLFENNLQKFVNRSLVIDISEQLQITRTVKRDKSAQSQIEAIIASQISRQDRLALADDIIDNSPNNQKQLLASVEALHQRYLQQAIKLTK